MKNKLIYSIIATLLISFSANADIVCVKRKVNVVNGQVRIARNVKRLPDTEICPSGYNLVADDFNLVKREEFDQTLAALPTREETDVLVGKVAEFTELIGDEESGFTKQILELDDAVNDPETGLVGKANQTDLDDVVERVTDLENVVGDDVNGLVRQVNELEGVVDDVTTDLVDVSTRVATVEDILSDDTTGLDTKASQNELNNVSNALGVLDAIVSDATTGLGSKASQTDFTVLATSVGTNSTNIASASNRILTLEMTVGNAESGLVKDNNTNKTNIATLITTVGDTESGLVKDVEEAQDNIGTLTNDLTDVKDILGDRSAGLIKDVSDLQIESQNYHSWDQVQIPFGKSVSGVIEIAKAENNTDPTSQLIGLPLAARKAITDADIIIDGTAGETDNECTGDAANPSAPAGKVCVYVFEGDKTELEGKGIGVDCSVYDNGIDCGAVASCGWTAPRCNGDADGCVDEADPSDENCSAHTQNGSCAFVIGECSSTVEKPVNRAFRLENGDDTAPIAATWIYQEVDAD